MKKWLEYNFTIDYFSEENSWTESTSPWTMQAADPPWTLDRRTVVLRVGSPTCSLNGVAVHWTSL
jgi:hypothetical protein